MSPTVNNFVHDLVAMAKAMEDLPGVQAQLEAAKAQINDMADTIQRLELRAIDRGAEIETLQSTIRNLEVARDDAELRFLELDERAAKAVRFLAQVQGMAVQAEVTLNPPKPEPEPEPKAPEESPSPVPVPEVEKVEEFGASVIPLSEVVQTAPYDSFVTHVTTDTQGPAEPTPAGPYVGKRYFHVSGYITRLDWIAGGGTDEDYDWRPSSGVQAQL